MYSFDLKYNSFVYPWQNSVISQRLRSLGKKDKTKIVYIYESPDSSTYRYRVHNMCEVLNTSGQFSATYVFVSELDFLLKYLEKVDFIVLVRVRWSIQLDKIFSKAATRGIKIYFDVDDLVYDITKVPLLMSSLGLEESTDSYNRWFSYVSRIFLAAKNSNAFITTNDYLSKKLTDFFNKDCIVAPNFINHEQMLLSNKLLELKKNLSNDNECILVGYFSGTLSHNNDFRSISADLCKLMEENERIRLRIVGYLDMPEDLDKFVDKGRIERIPLQNYLDLQVKIAECDINIIPLLINEFTHSKSEIKYFEASIVGVESIATPTFIYHKIIQDGKNGYLAMPGVWREKIIQAIEHSGQVIDAAKLYAVEHYFGENLLKKIENPFLG